MSKTDTILEFIGGLKEGEKFTQSEVARKFAVSRQLVYQIVQKNKLQNKLAGYSSRIKSLSFCAKCGKQVNPNRIKFPEYCLECARELDLVSIMVSLICPVCNTEFKRRKAEVDYSRRVFPNKKFHCSHICLGHANGTKYGWGVSKRI